MDNLLTTPAALEQVETQVAPLTTTPVDAVPTIIEAPSWYIDENTPAEGSRPEWLPEKYKTIKDAVIGGVNAVKMYSEALGAPEQYKLENPELKESPVLDVFSKVAKKTNLSNKLYNELVNTFVEEEKQLVEQRNKEIVNLKKEIGAERIEPANNWINSLKTSVEEKEKLNKVLGSSKEAFEVLEIMRREFTKQLTSNQPQTNIPYTPQDNQKRLKEIFSSREYKNNANLFKDEISRLTNKKAM
jgi:hypothetical protein